MLFQSIQHSFYTSKKNIQKISSPSILKKVNLLIQKTHQFCQNTYGKNHIFVQNYISKFINHSNQQLTQELAFFINKLQTIKQFQIDQLQKIWIGDHQGLTEIIIALWVSYVEYQIKKVELVQIFLTQQIYFFSQIFLSIFKFHHPTLKQKKKITSLRFTFLNRISQQKLFKQIMDTFINNFVTKKEIQFTKSQILETVFQLNNFIRFNQIEIPFQDSINMMIKFSEEPCLLSKIIKLNAAIANIRKQILFYRDYFKLEISAFGADQLLPVINYVCEKTTQNILAAMSYTNSFINHPNLDKSSLLNQVSDQSFYHCQLVESASLIYCHASKFK